MIFKSFWNYIISQFYFSVTWAVDFVVIKAPGSWSKGDEK